MYVACQISIFCKHLTVCTEICYGTVKCLRKIGDLTSTIKSSSENKILIIFAWFYEGGGFNDQQLFSLDPLNEI